MNRGEALPFLHLNRDPRLATGRFRTESEQEEYIRRGIEAGLPGVPAKPRTIKTRLK